MAAYCIICEKPVQRSQRDLKLLCDGCKIPAEESSISEGVHKIPENGENASQIKRTFQIVERGSNQGNPKLIDSFGYTYHVRTYHLRRRAAKLIAWQCTVSVKGKRCPAEVTQWRNGIFERNGKAHNHSPSAGPLTLAKIKSRIRQEVTADLLKPASVIVTEVLKEELKNPPWTRLPQRKHLIMMARRLRKKLRSADMLQWTQRLC